MKILKLHPEAKLPSKANEGDLGYDLYSLENVTMAFGNRIPYEIRTGIAIQFEPGFGGIIKERSSMAANGFEVCAGVIDNGYIGEIIVLARCFYGTLFIGKGQKIAQLIPQAVVNLEIEEVGSLLHTVRGDKGFGSSGA
jgi:dUTP pyrophosphatase